MSFDFTTQDVFYIKPPVDRVILVGMINLGTVKKGSSAIVHCKSGPIRVVIEGIELFGGGDPDFAAAGQQVGLRMTTIRKDQPEAGTKVTGTP